MLIITLAKQAVGRKMEYKDVLRSKTIVFTFIIVYLLLVQKYVLSPLIYLLVLRACGGISKCVLYTFSTPMHLQPGAVITSVIVTPSCMCSPVQVQQH